MPLPYTFLSGHVAKSHEVNANFNYVLDILGQLSTPGSIAQLGEFKLGPRMLALFSAAQDTGPDDLAFFQLAWNVNYNKVGSVWRSDRRIADNPATVVRVGKRGFSIYATSQTSGDLNNQLTLLLRLVATTSDDEILFVHDNVHMQNYDGVARNIQDFRLTTTLLENPLPVYAAKWVGKGTTIFNAYNLGVPASAKAILLYMHVTATNDSGAGMHAYQRRATNDAKAFFRGFVTHAPLGSGHIGHRAGSQGIVPLGLGAQKGDFIIHRTHNFELANVYIMGYLN